MKLKKLILWDLDDTLVNSKHRSRFFDNGSLDFIHFNENATPENIEKDQLIHPMVDLAKYFLGRPDCYNTVITSRFVTETDIKFMEKRGFYFQNYLYRGHALMLNRKDEVDSLRDYELKDILLTHYLMFCGFDLGFAFDDKPENIQIFKNHGLEVFDANQINNYEINVKCIIEQFENKFDK